MRALAFAIALIVAGPAPAQIYNPPSMANARDAQAQATADSAADQAAQALAIANAAKTSADASVKSVNGISPTSGNVPLPQIAAAQASADTAKSTADTAKATADSAASAVNTLSGIAVKSVNGINPTSGNVPLTAIAAAQATADAATVTANAAVKTVNAISPVAGNVTIATTSFLAGFAPASPGTWATLLSGSPCNAARLGSYAVVMDLYGATNATNEVIRCGLSGVSGYYWRPQRENYAASITVTGGNQTLSCGQTAPILSINGTFTSTMNFALSTAGCWPGAQFVVANNAILGLNALNFTGLVGGVTKSLGLNGRQTFYYDYTNNGFVAF